MPSKQWLKENFPQKYEEAYGTEAQSGAEGNACHDLPHPPRNKYSARATVVDGFRFDSQVESRFYQHLKMLQEAGKVVMFLRQVPFHLPGGTILRVDFQVFWQDGRVTFEDVKGRVTEQFKIKRREVEAQYGVRIRVVKSEDFE